MSGRPKLTLEEASVAVYLDFEGRIGEAPAVLGTLWQGRRKGGIWTRQALIEPRFESIGLPGVSSSSLGGELQSLILRCKKQTRTLVGWSEHEVQIVRAFAPNLADEFDDLYRDAKSVAKAWRTKVHPELEAVRDSRKRRHRLSLYASWVGCSVDDDQKRIGETLGRIQGAVTSGRSFPDFSDALQDRWRELLDQNMTDCRMTRCVSLHVLDDLRSAAS
jgi:hypothetical protein